MSTSFHAIESAVLMTDSSKFATTASVITLIKLWLQNEKRSYNDNYCNNYICNSYIFYFIVKVFK